MKHCFVVGLTGGLGSGKSTVLKMFARMGAAAFDCDREVHRLLDEDGPVKRRVIRTCGKEILGPGGKIEHGRLARIVFGLPGPGSETRGPRRAGGSLGKLKNLENILHPPVIRRLRSFCKRHCRVVADIPLLYEAKLCGLVDCAIVVWVPKHTQIRRALTRKGKNALSSRAEILARLRRQIPLNLKRRLADFVIVNSGTIAETRKQVRRIWHDLLHQADKL